MTKQEQLTEFMNNTIFRWSSFDPCFDVLPEEPHDFKGYEYASPEQANTLIKAEDGEIAWDLGTASHPGPPIRKMLFGIYGKDKFVADKWDITRKDLVGAATIKDWEWCEYGDGDVYDGEDDWEDMFTEENLLAWLNNELESTRCD